MRGCAVRSRTVIFFFFVSDAIVFHWRIWVDPTVDTEDQTQRNKNCWTIYIFVWLQQLQQLDSLFAVDNMILWPKFIII